MSSLGVFCGVTFHGTYHFKVEVHFIYLFVYLFIFSFLGLHPRRMEVPRLGVELEL